MASASELKKGSYFIYDNEPVRVIRKELVAYGTHSHSKLKLFIQGLHENGERSVNMHHTDKVETVVIIRQTGQVISKANGKVQIMDSTTYETLDASAPEELLEQLNEGSQVTFVELKGIIEIIEKR